MLALALGGRTVSEWQAAMTQREFARWVEFYRLFPFDDLHRFHRPAALLCSMQGGDFKKAMDALAPEPVPSGYSQAELNSFKAFGIKPPARNH